MRSCNVPGYGKGNIGPWHTDTNNTNPALAVVDDCANGGGASFVLTGSHLMMPGDGASLYLYRGLTGPQIAIRWHRVRVWYAARFAGSGTPITSHVFEYDSDGLVEPNTFVAYPGGEDLVLERAFARPAQVRQLTLSLSCSADPGASCLVTHGTPLHIRGIEVTLGEDAPPIVPRIAGSLSGGGTQAGIRTVTYSAFDHQSGLAKIEAILGDTVVASRDLTPRCPYYDWTVCPDSDEGTLEIDTRAVPNGSYILKLRATDAANNQQVAHAPSPVEIHNRQSLSLSLSERLTARFSGSARTTLVAPFGRRVRIQGQLTGSSGRGVGRARLEVFERTASKTAREHPRASVLTRNDGTFTHLLARGGPSRAVRITYRPDSSGPSVSRTLNLRVRAAASFRASLHGTLVRFGGRVLSLPVPPKGKRVLLQGKAKGYNWATFARIRANRNGRFTGRYRLPIRRPGVRLYIRVVVPPERGYPYAPYSGRPVMLRVH